MMRKVKKQLLFFTIFGLLNCELIIFAQSPPPLIYSAPEKSELKEFTAEDNTFQVTFPGIPKIAEQKITDGNITSYSTYRKGSNSIVNTIEYDFDVENQSKKIFENIKNTLLETPKLTIRAERNINFDGFSGKEFDVLQDYQYQKIRILIIGKRIYELRSDVTNWHILNQYQKEKIIEFEEETKRFFSSFKIKNSPKIVLQPPSDFLGTSTETNYKNTFFNFTFDFPKDWSQRKYAEIRDNVSSALENYTPPEVRNNKAFQESLKSETVIFGVSQKNTGSGKGTNLVFGVIKQPNPEATSNDVIEATKKLVLLNPKNEVIKETEKIRLNGTEFSTMTFQADINGVKIYQKILTTIRKSYSITFVLSYVNEDGLKSLEKIVSTIKFNPK